MFLRILLPLLIAIYGTLGYFIGPFFAPYLDRYFSGPVLGDVSLAWWLEIARWGSVIWLGLAGWASYTFYTKISLLRWQYEIIYFRFRDTLKVPGNRGQDFIWANLFGISFVTAVLGTVAFTVFVLPRLLTKKSEHQTLLGFLLFAFSGFTIRLTSSIVTEFFRPRELEEGVQFAGFNIDFLQSNRDLLKMFDQQQRKGYSSIPFSPDDKPNRGQETHDW
ncbi:MAG: hypothetical protein AAFY26_14050 [Cyanobacteria bacterium J06638_22]